MKYSLGIPEVFWCVGYSRVQDRQDTCPCGVYGIMTAIKQSK
jgi:hypothetical protein